MHDAKENRKKKIPGGEKRPKSDFTWPFFHVFYFLVLLEGLGDRGTTRESTEEFPY